MKKSGLAILLLFSFAGFLWAKGPVLSVVDFLVESDNPAFKYLGKGLSTLVAVELRKSAAVQLVEREQLNEILKEQELSLSDMADEQTQIRVGMLLSAQYLVLGEMIDMAGSFLISVRVADASSGEIIWQEAVNEKLPAYDYIGAFFAKSILEHFGVVAQGTTIKKVEKRREKRPEAVLALSEGVDAYDRKDMTKARSALEQARRLDPGSEAAAYYLSKLTVNTTKFQITVEQYYTYQNPAYLGIIQMDRLYLGGSMPVSLTPAQNPVPYVNSIDLPGNERYLHELYNILTLGYLFPIGKRSGISVDMFMISFLERLWDPSIAFDSATVQMSGFGGILSLGYRIHDHISIGIGIAVYGQSQVVGMPLGVSPETTVVAANGGILYFNDDKTFLFDSRVGYCTGTFHQLDLETFTEIPDEVRAPLYNENTVTWALKEHRTFIVLKQINEVAWDRPFYFGRLLPATEHFISDRFSMRAGIEASYAFLNGTKKFGFGALVGTTLRSIRRKIDLDFNVSYRMRPSRAVEGLLYPDFGFLWTISRNGLFLSRQ